MHGVDVAIERGIPTARGSGVRISVGGAGWSKVVRDMGHESVDADIAHEVRVWLLKRARGKVS
jgi:hypothetical protein